MNRYQKILAHHATGLRDNPKLKAHQAVRVADELAEVRDHYDLVLAALRAARTSNAEFMEAVKYEHDEDEAGSHICCGTRSYKDHADGCPAMAAQAAFTALGEF